jgi:hypothetical protein
MKTSFYIYNISKRFLSKCQNYQIVKKCPFKKPFFAVKSFGSRKKGRNLVVEKNDFGVF